MCTGRIVWNYYAPVPLMMMMIGGRLKFVKALAAWVAHISGVL